MSVSTRHPLDLHTTVELVGEERAAAMLDASWGSHGGLHGGYVAALVLRAAQQAIRDETRAARSLTVHLPAPLAPGPVEIALRVEREGRTLTVVSARVEQEGKVGAVGLAAFGATTDSTLQYTDTPSPSVPPPERCRPLSQLFGGVVTAMEAVHPFTRHLEIRPAAEPFPFTGSDRAELVAWVRLLDRKRLDAAARTVLVDALFPALAATLAGPIAVPTVELALHYAPDELEEPDEGWALVVARCWRAAGGFAYEDGELWRPDGTLLAKSRQLRRVLERPRR